MPICSQFLIPNPSSNPLLITGTGLLYSKVLVPLLSCSNGLILGLFYSVYFSIQLLEDYMPLIKILQWLSIAIRINPKVLGMVFSRPHELYPLPISTTTSQDNLGKEVITSTMLLWAHTVACMCQPYI